MMNIKKIVQTGLVIAGLFGAGMAYSQQTTSYYFTSDQPSYEIAVFNGSDPMSCPFCFAHTIITTEPGKFRQVVVPSNYSSIKLFQCIRDWLGTCGTYRPIGTSMPTGYYNINVADRTVGPLPEKQFEFNFPVASTCTYIIRFQNIANESSNSVHEETVGSRKSFDFSYNRIENSVVYPTYNLYPNLYDKKTGQKVPSNLRYSKDNRIVPKTEGLQPGEYKALISCPVAGHPPEIILL